MATKFKVAMLVAAALCLSTLLGYADCHQRKHLVEGKVYCDTCLVEFETTASYPLPDAKVILQCHNRTSGVVGLTVEGVTDKSGWYHLAADGDHEDEICEVRLVNSSDPDCNLVPNSGIFSARVSLTSNCGVNQVTRFANALGFAKKEALSNCPQILLAMGILPPGIEESF